MKRAALAALLALAVAAPAGATHDVDFVATGTIIAPSPTSRLIGGATEIVSPCNGTFDPDVPPGISQGVDGYWIELPLGAGGHAATLVADDPINDFDAWFYDGGCGLLLDDDARSMDGKIGGPDGDESGTIPVNAAWVVVDLAYGANASFTFTAIGAGN